MNQVSHESAQTLATLKDLGGIIGSFLIGSGGSVVAQDLPAYYGPAAYEVGPRVQRLRAALSMAEGDVSLCVLRYGSHKVSLRPIGEGLLAVIAEHDVNLPALRMATNLVAKKLGQAIAADMVASSTPPPPTVRPVAQPTASARARSLGAPEAQASRPKKNRAMYFRGKRID
jgi:predicted regulator of Ras-like GTPase activity (Roadblock/LC7/MglB family)